MEARKETMQSNGRRTSDNVAAQIRLAAANTLLYATAKRLLRERRLGGSPAEEIAARELALALAHFEALTESMREVRS